MKEISVSKYVLIIADCDANSLEVDVSSADVCTLQDDPTSWENLFGMLSRLEAVGGGGDIQLSVLADLGLRQSSRVLSKLAQLLVERPLRYLSYAYVIPPRQMQDFDSFVLGLSSAFKRVFVLTLGTGGGAGARVLKAHRIPELRALIHFRDAPATAQVAAWSLSVPQGEPERRPGDDRASDLLEEAVDSVDMIVEDIKGRLGKMLEMVESLGRKEIGIYQTSIPAIKELLDGLSSMEPKPDVVDWDAWFATLPHGLEVKVRLSLAVEGVDDLLLSLEELVAALPKPQGDERWEGEAKVVAIILDKIFPIEKKKWLLPIPPVLRERITSNCRRLLRAIDSPLIRRRMLESLLHYILAGRKKDGALAEANGMEHLQSELRGFLQQAHGDGTFLVLPRNSMRQGQRNELRSWIEQLMGRPCEIVLTDLTEAWFYVETTYEHRTNNRVESSPAARSVDTMGDEGEPSWIAVEPQSASPPVSVSVAPVSASPPRRCLDCGAPLSASPLPTLPTDGEPASFNSSRPRKSCPTCGRLNTKDWWVCWNHGKAPILIAIDKARCPDCILSHHENPEGFPLSRISVNPHYREPILCPNCVSLRRRDPGHPIFEIPEEMEKYYRDGVNGHDSVRFREVVRKVGLFGDCYCPSCGTILIPVHHKAGSSLPS